MSRHRFHPNANDNRPQWFDDLLLQYEPFLRRQCWLLLPDDPDAYQEAACRALEQWYRFKRDGSFTMWLKYIVRHMRYERSRLANKVVSGPTSVPIAQNATQDLSLMIKESLDGNEVLGLSVIGYNGREIAAMTGVCRKTVTLRLREARAANDNYEVAQIA